MTVKLLGVGVTGRFICREAFVWSLQGIVVLAHFGDSGFGVFFVLPECWNMLVCHDACHRMVLCRYDCNHRLSSSLIRLQVGDVDLYLEAHGTQ